LYIYGQHSSLERWFGLIEVFNRYGGITVPDLPGLGGMDSFYKVGQKPTLDNLADYLATFIRWRYKRKKIVIVAMSFGFLVATRMLQKYPELVDKVEFVISIVGFAHYEDFAFSRRRFLFYKVACAFFSLRVPAWFFQHVFLNPAWLRLAYKHSYNARDKFAGQTKAELKKTMDIETKLWKINDIRTQMFCNGQMFTLDNCKHKINLPLYHVAVGADRYLDQYRVEQHLRVVFDGFYKYKARLNSHSISIIADAKAAEAVIPLELKRVLRNYAQ
jgi:pimeloyl-ACP methyl ester carboxylesterase